MAIGKQITILVNGHNLACALTSFDPSGEMDELDATVLCNTDREWEAGFANGEISASGIWKYDSSLQDQIHDLMVQAMDTREELIVTSSFGPITVGVPAVMMNTVSRNYAINNPNGELITVDLALRSNNALNAGRWLMNTQLNAGTTNGTNVDHGASTNTGLLFQAHLHNATATDVDVVLQHSVDNSTWVDLVTISNLSAIRDAGYATVADGVTINRHLRARAIVTGGNTVLVSAAAARLF